MRNNKFSNNSNYNLNNDSIHGKLFKLLESSRPEFIKNIKEALINNKAITKQLFYESLQIEEKTLGFNREMQLYDHSKLVKDNLNNKPLTFTQFNQLLEMLNRDQYHSISEHNQKVKMKLNDFVNSIGEEINYKPEIKTAHSNPSSIEIYPYQLKYMYNHFLRIYNQLEFERVNQIKENSATILSDPERQSKVDPVITDHEYVAKFCFAYMLHLKSINCYKGKGSTDLIISASDLKRLGLIKDVEKLYLYADFKTGSFSILGYNENNENQNIMKFIDFITDNIKTDLFLIDIHPYTRNINENNIDKLDKLIQYLEKCKEKLNDSEDDIIKNKKVLFFDSNIPKVDINDYYDKLAELNGIDSEVFDLFKEQIQSYINYLEGKKLGVNEDGINDIRNRSVDDLSNNYIRNDAGIYVPQHLLNSSGNQISHSSSNNMTAKNVALTIKYTDASHLTEKELNDFFSE